MKKTIKIPLLLIAAVLLVCSNAMALNIPFSSTGSVAVEADSATTGTATFTFTIDDSVAKVSEAAIEFETDIFAPLQVSDFTVINPGAWTTSLSTGSNGYQFSTSSGGPFATADNDPIIIEVDYTLLDANMATESSEGVVGGWEWDEGQIWALAYTLYGEDLDIDFENRSFSLTTYTSGGSTAVPEPSHMLLLGTGFMFLVFGSRKKLIK